MTNALHEARDVVFGADKIIVFAGAGMSADVGIPVYWAGAESQYGGDVTSHGYTHLEHAYFNLWYKKPALQAKYFNELWDGIKNTSVTEADSPYVHLKKWLDDQQKDYFIVTTNVDDAFRRSGYDEKKIYEVHGSYRNSQCLTKRHGVFPTVDPKEGYTRCPVCSAIARPNVLFFNDYFFNDKKLKKAGKRFGNFTKKIDAGSAEGFAVLEIGVGTKVDRLRNATTTLNVSLNVPTIRINAFQTDLTDSPENLKNVLKKTHCELTGTAAEVLPELLKVN